MAKEAEQRIKEVPDILTRLIAEEKAWEWTAGNCIACVYTIIYLTHQRIFWIREYTGR
jgi:hypothetical protein